MSSEPTQSDAGSRTPGDHEKLRWEIEKLRAETEHLRRPTYLSPTTLISLATAAVAIIGAGFQYQINQVRAARADLDASQNVFRAEQARSDLARLETARNELVANIDAMRTENDKIGERLAQTRAQVARAEAGIRAAAATAASPEAMQALTEAQRTVAGLEVATGESEQVRAAQSERLNTIRSRVLAPGAPVPDVVVVPELVGRTAAGVRELLARASLAMGQVITRPSPQPPGTVIGQTPSAGTRVRVGTQVAIDVASAALVPVPGLQGMTEERARESLARARLAMGDVIRRPSPQRPGTAIDQNPSAGTQVSVGTPVAIVVAVPVLVPVPGLQGMTEERARELLARNRLGMGQVMRRPSTQRPGTVIDQNPAAGTQVSVGTQVAIVVSAIP